MDNTELNLRVGKGLFELKYYFFNSLTAISKVIDLVVTFFFSPKGQVFFEKFNDTLGISEVIFLKFIDLVKGFLERLVS